MGVPLLRDAFHRLRAAPIAFAVPPDATDQVPVERLSEIVSSAEDRVTAWRSQATRLMKEVRAASERHLADGGSVGEVVADLEMLRDEVQARLDRSAAWKERADRLAAAIDGNSLGLEPEQSRRLRVRSDRMQELMGIEIEVGSRFLDFLTGFLADTDPDARGGPTFDNADDLIAYLNG